MSQNCCVPGCLNNYKRAQKAGKVIKFYAFPSYPWLREKREQWIKFVKRKNADGTDWKPGKYNLICSEHFVGGCRSEDPRSPAYNPTIYDPKATPKKDPNIQIGRYKRAVARANRLKDGVLAAKRPGKLKRQVSPSTLSSQSRQLQGGDSTSRSPELCEVVDISDDDDEEVVPLDIDDGPTQPLCVICCDPCSSGESDDNSYSNNAQFMRFCSLLYPSLSEGNAFLNSLKSFDNLSVCSSCLSTIDIVITENSAVNKISVRVGKLQLSLLEEMRNLQNQLNQFQVVMGKLQDYVHDSGGHMDKFLIKNKYTDTKKQDSNNDILTFRRKLVRKVEMLEKFTKDLGAKVIISEEGIPSSTFSKDKGPEVLAPREEDLEHFPVPSPPKDPPPTTQLEVEAQEIPPPPSPPTLAPKKKGNKQVSFSRGMIVGKTLLNGADPNSQVLLKHVWDGKRMQSIRPPNAPTCRAVVTASMMKPNERVSCRACKKEMSVSCFKCRHRQSCPGTSSKAPAARVPVRDKPLCHLCSKVCGDMRALNTHVKFAHGDNDKPFLCDQCPKACQTLGLLRMHQRSHSDPRTFECRKGCGVVFRSPVNRKRHEATCIERGMPPEEDKANQAAS